METLTELPNIGSVLARRLVISGIHTPGAFMEAGSRNAFRRMMAADPDTCLSTLYALEGAMQNMRWHMLPEKTKKELRAFYESLETAE